MRHRIPVYISVSVWVVSPFVVEGMARQMSTVSVYQSAKFMTCYTPRLKPILSEEPSAFLICDIKSSLETSTEVVLSKCMVTVD